MKLRIEKAVYGGSGLARIPPETPNAAELAGKTVFIPYALPGELVEAHITGGKRGFSTAEIDSILEPAAGRVVPGCRYFPACGGCQYQYASPGDQLAMKLDILKDTLERAHLVGHSAGTIDIRSIHASPWGYRNRIRLHVTGNANGFALCYRERGSHRNLPVTLCPIAAPLLERALAAVTRIGAEVGLAGLCDEIEFFANAEEKDLLTSLFVSRPALRSSIRPQPRVQPEARMLEEFSERLKAELPEFAGSGLFSAEGRELLAQWGQHSLTYAVSDRGYQVSLGSFFQVNRFLIPQLLELVVGNRSGPTAWDLYAGVGLFSQALRFQQVIAVEAAPLSAADLRHNLAHSPHRAIQSTTLDFLRSQSRHKPQPLPQLILVDPPRAGLGPEVTGHLARIAAPEIVYISCDPSTLARDLQALLPSGYRLKTLYLVDMFPQTFHVETIAVLARN